MIRDLTSPPKTTPPQTQNLIEQVSVEKAERGSGFYFGLALDALTLSFALWTGLLFRNFLEFGGSLYAPAIASLGLAVCLSLGLHLTKKIMRRIVILAGVALGLFIFLVSVSNLAFIAVAIVCMFLFLLWGETSSRSRISNSLDLRFLNSVQPLLTKTTTGIILAGIVAFLPYWTPERGVLPRETFDSSFEAIGGMTKQFYGEIKLTGTFSEFAGSIARYQLFAAPDFKKLPPTRQQEVIEENSSKITAGLADQLGISAEDKDKPMNVIFYNLTLQSIQDLQKRLGVMFLGLWAILLFLILRSVGTVAYWVSALIGFFVFQTLLAMGAIRIKGETQTQEVVEYTS